MTVARRSLTGLALCFLLAACDNYYRNDYKDNTPTSGKLKVCYDEGLHLHVRNQAFTFQSQYPAARLELVQGSETEAILALLKDSCESAFLSRQLDQAEEQRFISRNFVPKLTPVAYSGIAVIVHARSWIGNLSLEELAETIRTGTLRDSSGTARNVQVIFDRNNSSVMRHISDSLLKGGIPGQRSSTLNSSREAIEYVSKERSALALIDFAWLSDADDSLFLSYKGKIRFAGIAREPGQAAEFPSQSSFKLRTYPMTRPVYMLRKTGDFTLAKGFESFVAGQKGQLTFLKQGLLPHRQPERTVEIRFE